MNALPERTLLPTPSGAGAAGPTEAQRADWDRDGFLVVPGFFGPAETEALVRWTGEIAGAPEVPGSQMVYYEDSLTVSGTRVVQRIEDFCRHHPGMDALARHGALSHWIATLTGEETVLFKDKINFKYPGGDGFKAHQDQQAGWTSFAPVFVTALVTIDAATIENGCLELAEGKRVTTLIGEEWKPLAEEGLRLRPVPTAPGDVIFFDSFVPHASKPNFTGHARRVLYLTYNALSAGDHRVRYFDEKRAAFPPDIERKPGQNFTFRV